MSQDEQPIVDEQAEIVPIGGQRLAQTPGRAWRNKFLVELGTLKMPKGNVRCYANNRNGSLLFVMPDQTGFTIDTGIAGNQFYKYWLLAAQEAIPEGVVPDAAPVDTGLIDINGQPILK